MSHRILRSIGSSAALFVLMLGARLVVAQQPAPSPAPSQQKSITGTVVTVDDKPAQTRVQLFVDRSKYTGGPTPIPPGGSKTGDAVLGAPEPLQLQKPAEKPWKETDTDSAGKFTFTGVGPGKYVVVAGSDGNVAKVKVEVKANEDPKPLALKLPSK